MAKTTKDCIPYAVKIGGALSQIFDKDSEYYLEIDDENVTEVIHALANIVPSMVYEKITGDNKTAIEFNHLANSLCFQYGTKED